MTQKNGNISYVHGLEELILLNIFNEVPNKISISFFTEIEKKPETFIESQKIPIGKKKKS
jgi:hypothetical protein